MPQPTGDYIHDRDPLIATLLADDDLQTHAAARSPGLRDALYSAYDAGYNDAAILPAREDRASFARAADVIQVLIARHALAPANNVLLDALREAFLHGMISESRDTARRKGAGVPPSADPYIELVPRGPALGTAPDGPRLVLRRQFARPIANDRLAVIRVSFDTVPCPGGGPAMLRTKLTYVATTVLYEPLREATYANVVETTEQLPPGLDDSALVQRLWDTASAFDPALLRWDGIPGSEMPCDIITFTSVPAEGPITPFCRAHHCRPLVPAYHTVSDAEENFVCDRGNPQLFLVDSIPDTGRPRVTDLSGLRVLIRSAHAADPPPQDHMVLWRYAGGGRLELLALQRVPGRGNTAHNATGTSVHYRVVSHDNPQVEYARVDILAHEVGLT